MPRAIASLTVYPRHGEHRQGGIASGHDTDAELAAKIRQSLADVPAAEKRSYALSLAQSLNDDAVAALGNAARIDILECFLPKTKSQAEQTQTMRLLTAMQLDPAFVATQNKVIDHHASWLHKNYLTGYYLLTWHKFSDVGAMLFLKKIAAHHAESLGIPTAQSFDVMEQAPRGRVVRNAWYDPATRAITLNGHHAACLYEIKKAMAMTGHIMSLHHQTVLLERLDIGSLTAQDPSYTQARIFRLDRMAGSAMGPFGDWLNFKRRPSERHADWVAAQIRMRLNLKPPAYLSDRFEPPKKGDRLPFHPVRR